MANQPHTVSHQIEPVFDERSRVLVLGTMPSPKSREAGFFYGHPRNRFWPALAAAFSQPMPATVAERRAFCLRNRVALWDVLASCTITGASDASIADPVPNDLGRILDHAPIGAVFCTGATAQRLYEKLCQPLTGIPATRLPSPSPANAACSLEALAASYRQIADTVEVSGPHARP